MDVVWEYLPCCSKPKASFANQCCMVLTLACSYTGPSVTSAPVNYYLIWCQKITNPSKFPHLPTCKLDFISNRVKWYWH